MRGEEKVASKWTGRLHYAHVALTPVPAGISEAIFHSRRVLRRN